MRGRDGRVVTWAGAIWTWAGSIAYLSGCLDRQRGPVCLSSERANVQTRWQAPVDQRASPDELSGHELVRASVVVHNKQVRPASTWTHTGTTGSAHAQRYV